MYNLAVLTERIHKALAEMGGNEVAELLNKEFGMEITYNGDGLWSEVQDYSDIIESIANDIKDVGDEVTSSMLDTYFEELRSDVEGRLNVS